MALNEPQAAEMAVRHLTLTVGLSKIVVSPMNIQRASVALPDVIEFVAVSADAKYVALADADNQGKEYFRLLDTATGNELLGLAE